jgi:hypothetical protein
VLLTLAVIEIVVVVVFDGTAPDRDQADAVLTLATGVIATGAGVLGVLLRHWE